MSKTRRFKSKPFLQWIHELGCTINNERCGGPIQAHHLLKPWAGGRGMGMKADDRNVIPLCMNHHSELHTQFGDEFQFFAHYSKPEDYGQKLAEALYDEGVNLNLIE